MRLADLPDIASLTYESDFTVFMAKGVPKALRNQALKKLWRSNPLLANLDGLNDYDLDYRPSEIAALAARSAADLARGRKWRTAGDRDAAPPERVRAGSAPRAPEDDAETAARADEPPEGATSDPPRRERTS